MGKRSGNICRTPDLATLPSLPERTMTSSRPVGMLWPLGAVTLTAAFLLVYYPTLEKLSGYWATNETYSFGFLVPVISAYLIWLRRERLQRVRWSPSFLAGGLILGAGLATLILGRLSSINMLEEVSLPVSIYGLVLLIFGAQLTASLSNCWPGSLTMSGPSIL